jgi:WS/DGAT/MGAT family acyltransferase
MRQLSGADSAFLHLETDETPMNVVGVLILDPSAGADYSFERFRDTLLTRMHLLPPLTRRLVEVPLHLGHPAWIERQPVDLDHHLRRVTAPAPGDARSLGAVVGELAASRLDHGRPLWQMTVVEGLEAGRVAVVAMLHHAAITGAAGAEFIAELLDLDPTAPSPPAAGESEPPEQAPGPLRLLTNTALHQAGAPLRLGAQLVGSARGLAGLLSRPRLPARAQRSPLNGGLTPRRSSAFVRVALSEVKQVKEQHHATVNDVLLAVLTAALRGYLVEHDLAADKPLVASCPIAAGSGSTESTDQLSAMLVPLPIQLSDPVEQLAAVSAATKDAKQFASGLGLETMAAWADLTAPQLLRAGAQVYSRLRLADRLPPMQNLIVSNVMGPPIPLYAAGARVDGIYPLGPLLPGTGLNITVLSNVDNVDVGLLACPDLVPDVWDIADRVPPALQSLLKAR